MARRLDDTEDRRPGDRPPTTAARTGAWSTATPRWRRPSIEAERPARHLTGLPKLVVSTAAVAVSLYALFWVVRPQPAQPYPDHVPGRHPGHDPARLPAPGPGPRRQRREPEGSGNPRGRPGAGHDDPGWFDWVLAGAGPGRAASTRWWSSTTSSGAPSSRRPRRGPGRSSAAGPGGRRRTVGWILPAVCVVFVLYAYYGGYLPFDWAIGHRGYDIDRTSSPFFMGTDGVYGVPLDVAATYIVLFTVYGAVLDYLGGGQVLRRRLPSPRSAARAPPRAVRSPSPGSCSARSPAPASRPTVSWDRRLADPAQGRIPARAGRRRARRGRASARSCRLPRSAPRRSSSPSTCESATSPCCSTRPSPRSCTTWASSSPSRSTPAGTARGRRRGRRRGTGCWLRFGYHFSSLFVIVVLMALGCRRSARCLRHRPRLRSRLPRPRAPARPARLSRAWPRARPECCRSPRPAPPRGSSSPSSP